MTEENIDESTLNLYNEPINANSENSAACEPTNPEAELHTWASSTAPGWFICTRCGAAAICPECLPAGAGEPDGAFIWKCLQHNEATRG